MFKTERNVDLSDTYKEPIQSKYMGSNKKKYYLASVDHNLNQLKDEQLTSLTNLLITLKSEYDELKRETIVRDRETDDLKVKILMLEKVEKKTGNKTNEMEENYSKIESLIEMKKVKRDEELYNKTTHINLIEKMKEELLLIKKDINTQEAQTKVLTKTYEKERIEENTIKEKVNQVYSKINSLKAKNTFDRNENNLILQYYQNIIEQKWSFIHSADDRKAKQIKIAIDAKNDSQDKQEVEKRKVLFMYLLYDKYLKKKMEKELLENTKLEETFQTCRDITGSSNIKTMVDKILNKDKNYNLCVSRVAQRQNQIEILRKDIFDLEKEYQRLKNDVTEEELEKVNLNPPLAIEEGESALINEEKTLLEDLKALQEKHRNVRLVYEKVLENIKALCKYDRKEDITANVNVTQSMTLNESRLVDSSHILSAAAEEDILKSYFEFLEGSRKTMESLFLNHSKEDFITMMIEKGLEPVQSEKTKLKIAPLNKGAKGVSLSEKQLVKELQKVQVANEEYDYSDEELKREDDEIKREKDEIMKKYKEMERHKLEQALKTEKEKTK